LVTTVPQNQRDTLRELALGPTGLPFQHAQMMEFTIELGERPAPFYRRASS
jgi:hypothetical protein